METIAQDLRYGLRQLRKNPGFTTIAALTLALGIALNATMFSLVSAFLFRRPPGRDPDRVAVVSSVDPANGFHADVHLVSVPNYLAWRDTNHVFSTMAAADDFRTSSLTADHESEALHTAAASANYFNVLDVKAQLGRTFQPGEDQSGQDHVVILSHEFWERRFASDTSLIGRTIRLNRETYTVIGVMPASFRLLGYAIQLWTPLTITPSDQTAAARKDRSLHVYARLKPGVTIGQARADLDTLAHRAQESFPDIEKGWGTSARTLPDFLLYDFGIGNGLAIMMMTVGFVLLIACTNVAGLLLARAAGRRKEMAIRRALGAGRHRLVRQLLTEGVLIAFLGGGLGLLLSRWGITFLAAQLQFNEAIRTIEVRLDWTVLLFTTVVSLLCALLCALAPALNASRTEITTHLKDESRAASASRSHARLRTILVMGEIAMAMFLLVGAGLLIRALLRIEHQSLGFRTDHLLTAGISLDAAHYKDASRQSLFVRDLILRVSQLPGTESVSVTSDLPATGPASVPVRIQGEPDLPSNQAQNARDVLVTPDYFRTSDTPLQRGRTFTETDDTTSPYVALVNQEFVNHYFPNQEPLGKQIRLDINGNAPEWREIVGVVSNVKTFSESIREESQIYEPFFQRPLNSFSVMIRTASDPGGLASALRNTVAQMDAELPLSQVMTMEAVVEQQRYGDPLFVRLMSSFAVLALTLSSIGIYGLIAYSVGQRIHEIGIRMALGARSQDILGMVLSQGVKVATIGGAIGLALALPLPKVFSAMFTDLPVSQPAIYLVVPVVILLVATLATYAPARRAARVEPMTALRQE